MIHPDEVLKKIPLELDHNDWHLAFDDTDIQVYSREKASLSPLVGFKTVTYHHISSDQVFEFLKDVCGAMNRINHLFIHGEEFRGWPSKIDPEGRLVRTSFKMPFPMKNREFLHGLHCQKVNDRIQIIGYTPIEAPEIKVQKDFIRCPMYISGQRITILNNGTVRVEHLMVYALAGSISHSLQDRWFKKSHIKAYVKEWRNLRKHLFPQKSDFVYNEELVKSLKNALNESEVWHMIGKQGTGTVKIGRLPYCSKNAIRTDIVINRSIEKVVNVIGDKSLEFLPLWNKEFMHGEILEELEKTDKRVIWLIKVRYKTPFFISNREYVYLFSREWLNQDECIITYHSVNHRSPVPKGFVRAVLYPSVHLCTRHDNDTYLSHLLVTDLGATLGKIQNNLLRKSLIKAHYRDMKNQTKLFRKI